MRFTHAFGALSLLALAACASPPNAAAPAAQVAADAQDPNAATVKRPKVCITGTRTCSKEQTQDQPVQSMSGAALAQGLQGHQVSGQNAIP